MRWLPLFFVLAVVGCADELAPASPVIAATGLVLTPSAATVDTAGSLQVQARLLWADGAEHAATVTFYATGGTISTTGLYHAGLAAGQFLVIATCACRVADTVNVTVTAASGPRTVATMNISVSGLPSGNPAQVDVSGPGGYHRAVTGSVLLDSLAPGDYSLQATDATIGTDQYTAAPPSQSVTLAAADNKTVTVLYSRYTTTNSTGLPAHPRVWMTPQRVAFVQAQAFANTVRWQRVKSAANAELGGVTVNIGMLPELCLAYIGTGDARYATRAGVILAAYAVPADSLTRDSGYDFRFIFPVMTAGLDWCYAGLTVAQRHQVASWLMDRADWVWPETNPARAGSWGVANPKNNYWWGFMQTGPAALAAAGDDTGAGTVSGTDRPAYHRQLALNHWTTVALPYFAIDGVGGAWLEGTGYDSSWYVARFADAFSTAGASLPSTPFLADALRWHLASTLPDSRHKVPFGDQARVSDGPLFTYDRVAVLDLLAAVQSDPALTAQTYGWLNRIGQQATSEIGATMSLSDELLRFDPSAASSDLSGFPGDYLAHGAGDFIYRQSWTDPNATVMAFESGTVHESHSALDANGLMIWKGQYWISADANIFSHSGIVQPTTYYNNVTVGGVGQSHNAGTGQIISTQVSDQLVVVRGQAASAYGSGSSRPLTDYLRTVAYLPQQSIFVVVDRVTAANPAQAKVWRWHTKDVPQISGNSFTLQNPGGDARCLGSVLLPSGAALGTESYALGTGAAPSSNAVTVSMSGRATDLVVTVLQCGMGWFTGLPATVELTPAGTLVTVGTQRVLVPNDDAQPVTFDAASILRNP